MDAAGSDEPVELVVREPREWAARYASVSNAVQAAVVDASIEHIGSTAVEWMPAKDVVDVLIGVETNAVGAASNDLVAAGWVIEGQRSGHAWLRDASSGPRRTVLHIVVRDGAEWRRRLAFRDLLRSDERSRVLYLAVKRGAASRSAGWGEYTAGKAATVRWLLTRAGEID